MAIKSDTPQICALRERVENKFGKKLNVHSDFVELTSHIEMVLRQHVSETTLERVWNYSSRGYDNVSLRTLDVLSQYATDMKWEAFCIMLRDENKIESEVFDAERIVAEELSIGDKIRFAWLPDRLCIANYLGDNKFIAEHCENSTIKDGDTFYCMQFILGKELQMKLSESSKVYIVGSEHGLTSLKKM